ncbi:hypothetical protein ACFQYP_23385 [Nonomuraea antimicrobica]
MLGLVTLAALTVVMPVVVGLVVAGLTLALRVGDHYFGDTGRTLSKSALVAAGHLALSLAVGLAAAGFLNTAGRLSAGHAESLAAGVFTLGLFVLPGAGAVRRTASRTLARLLPGHRATVVSVAVMGPIALTSVIVALVEGL